jgi:hypothetical protein
MTEIPSPAENQSVEVPNVQVLWPNVMACIEPVANLLALTREQFRLNSNDANRAPIRQEDDLRWVVQLNEAERYLLLGLQILKQGLLVSYPQTAENEKQSTAPVELIPSKTFVN